MPDLLPQPTRLQLVELEAPLGREKLARLEHVLVIVPRSMPARAWKQVPAAEALRRLARRKPAPDAVPAAQTRLANKLETGVSLCTIDAGLTPFGRLSEARRAIAHVLAANPASLGLVVAGYDEATAGAIAEAVSTAALAATATMPHQKSKPRKPPRLRRLALPPGSSQDFHRSMAEHHGNHVARWLTSLPPNELNAARYRQRVELLADEYGWSMKFLDNDALEKKGAGAFLAVSRAGDVDAGIVHLQYRPAGKAKRPDLALVGKGICFDTGGVNIKPAQYMRHMHDDMQGSAVALGVLIALTRLEIPLAVDCWLAISENLIGRDAYKPAEIITAVDGTTIEIVHTDAEGRMVLADTLAMASATTPRVMIDYATLTGACVTALTDRYSGAFTNRPLLHAPIIEAGRASGERVWPFPIDADFDEELRSTVADIRQCRINGEGDHILAARFLSRFVKKVPWLHFDLASGRHKGGLAHIPTDVTGFGVRMTLNLLQDQNLLGHCE